MTVEELNGLTTTEAQSEFKKCCVSTTWINSMLEAMPFQSVQDVYISSDESWNKCSENDFLEAATGHPKIGDLSSLAKKYANTSELASGEQSGMSSGNATIIKRLAEGNIRYEDKFGFIFIVCATGKSAAEMLYLLEQRLDNNRNKELEIAAAQQLKITTIRLENLLT